MKYTRCQDKSVCNINPICNIQITFLVKTNWVFSGSDKTPVFSVYSDYLNLFNCRLFYNQKIVIHNYIYFSVDPETDLIEPPK